MKYFILFILMIGSNLSFAQSNSELRTEKLKDYNYQGEIGLSINAVPFLDWTGNLFNNSIDNSFSSYNDLYLTNNNLPTISLRYFLDNKTSVRANFGLQNINRTSNQYVQDDASNSSSELLIDRRKTTFSANFIGLSYEKRRGDNRVKGIYGLELFRSSVNDIYNDYTYANNFNSTNLSPTSHDWSLESPVSLDSRIIQEDFGSIVSYGLRPYIGVEYFLSPQISIGTEIGISFTMSKNDETFSVHESYDITSETIIIERKKELASGKQNTISTDNYLSKITLSFIF
jgi:hypothetical protein